MLRFLSCSGPFLKSAHCTQAAILDARRDWDIHPDGSRFVLAGREDEGDEAPLVLVTDRFEELKALIGN